MDRELEAFLNSWVCQRHGLINKYNPEIHQGTQPVRVVHYMLTYMFANSHPEFIKELREQIAEGKLNPKLDLIYGEVELRFNRGFRTPKVSKDTRAIQIHESFLSYLWCITYSIFVLYVETIDYPEMNTIAGHELYTINEENVIIARELFEYGKSLIAFFSPWDKDALPNPETYLAEKRNYPEQTTMYYTEAVKFILCHEYTHLKKHIDKIDDETPVSHYLDFEIEADNEAIRCVRIYKVHSILFYRQYTRY